MARAAAEAGEIEVADASSSKVFAADQVQHLLADLIALVHRHGDPGDPVTTRRTWLYTGQWNEGNTGTWRTEDGGESWIQIAARGRAR